jgi:hypothetical protein
MCCLAWQAAEYRLSLALGGLSTCFPEDRNRSSLRKITAAFLSCHVPGIV